MKKLTLVFSVLMSIGCADSSPETSGKGRPAEPGDTSLSSCNGFNYDTAMRDLMGSFQRVPADAQRDTRPLIKLPFSLSKETTYLVRPLRDDGTIDYVDALNQAARVGVTPENNAAVLLMQVVGPSDLEEEFRDRFYKMIGMDPLPVDGDYFVPMERHFPSGIAKAKKALRNRALHTRWSRKQYPSLAEWIDRNEQPLARIAAALERPRYYMPHIAPEESSLVVFSLLFSLKEFREVGQALVMRSILRLNDGELQEAWEDLKATFQLASLISQGPSLVESLVSVDLQEAASRALCEIVESDELTAALSRRMLNEMLAIPSLSSLADRVNFGARFSVIEGTIASALEGKESVENDDGNQPFMDPVVFALVNWDQTLHVVNSWYDRLVDAHQIEDYPARKRAFDKIERKKVKYIKILETMEYDPLVREHFGDREYTIEESTSYAMGIIHIGLLAPASVAASDVYYRSLMQRNLACAALATVVYRFENGSLPEDLSDLAPSYLPNVPKDLYSTQTLLFRRIPAGHLLYSVGPNLRDERGVLSPTSGGADDLSVTVPD